MTLKLIYNSTLNGDIALSIELALKSLYYDESSNFYTSHCLKSIFKKLSKDTQLEIENITVNKLKHSLYDSLSNHSKVFVDWRYIHEKLDTAKEVEIDTDELKEISFAVLEVLDKRIKSISH